VKKTVLDLKKEQDMSWGREKKKRSTTLKESSLENGSTLLQVLANQLQRSHGTNTGKALVQEYLWIFTLHQCFKGSI